MLVTLIRATDAGVVLRPQIHQVPAGYAYLTPYTTGVMVVQSGAIASTTGDDMRLRFLGIIPNTPVDDSPTIWLDDDTGDLLIQSYKATEAEVKACQEIGSIPGHSTDVPDHETIIRLPAVMLKYIPRPEGSNGEVPRT